MSVTAALTPADLLTLPPPIDGKGYELSKGELVVRPLTGQRHDETKISAAYILIGFTLPRDLGRVYVETCFALSDDTARVPDVAFVSHAKRRLKVVGDSPTELIPDLVIEVISPSERVLAAEEKVDDYLTNGVPEVWQLFPRTQRLRVRTRTSLRDLSADDFIETPVLPGFRVQVAEFFVY